MLKMPVPRHTGPDPTLAPRLAGAAGLTVLLAANVGLKPALSWLAVVLVAALSVNLAGRRVSRLPFTSDLQRVSSAISVAVETFIWTGPAILFWRTGQPLLEAAAIGLLFLQLFFAAAFAYRETVSQLICGAPPAVVLLVLTLGLSSGPPLPRLTLALVMAGAIAFALGVARINMRHLDTLSAQAAPPGEKT